MLVCVLIITHILNAILRIGDNMPTVQEQNKKERLSFFVNSELSNKVNRISKQTNLPVSEIARKALQNFIDQVEKEKFLMLCLFR